MDQQAASLQHRNDIEALRQEMKANMESQLQDLLKESCETLNKALEQRDLELNERVNAVQATLMVEKETEIANLEHRYARRQGTTNHRSLQPDRMDTMETSTTTNGSSMPVPTRSPEQHTCLSAWAAGPSARAAGPSAHASGPSLPVSAVTPNLDTIRRLRKKRRVSCKTRLIGVPLEEQNEGNSPRAPSTEREPSVPPHNQLPNPQTSAFTDALTRGVESALRNIFASGQFSQYTKQSPRKRRIHAKEVDEIRVIETQEEHNFYLEKVRLLFQEKFNFAHDMDFIIYEPADKDEVHAYEYKDGPGPNPERLQFDLAKNSKSPWNSTSSGQYNGQIPTSDDSSQNVETPAKTEARLVAERQVVLKQCRQTTRRRSRYARRVAVLDHIVKLKTEGNEDDAGAWKWLQRLVKTLGEHGMSSDESDIGNDVEEVLRVKNMGWRRSIARELDLVDLQQLVDTDIFAPQGSRPMRRIRAPAPGLPASDSISWMN
ncbi:hypothetical protein BKA83DRAFT_4546285 [Pisolithus microcarpus]|nr:hypothetical protein BKA83DRAFT_4546285 [Pisolithus microcarpus]